MHPSDFRPCLTADGSSTLYSNEMQESYHSLNGACQESLHVFIRAGLDQLSKKKIQLFEVGFGTGLNALLTWESAIRKGLEIQYQTVDAWPIDLLTAKSLDFGKDVEGLPEYAYRQLHLSAWEQWETLQEGCFHLKKVKEDFTRMNLPDHLDLVYFDAFAPDKQPEMWEEHLFQKLFDALSEGGLLVTYCAKGEIRRRLQRCGFVVERLPGPPGKREMLRASRPSVKAR